MNDINYYWKACKRHSYSNITNIVLESLLVLQIIDELTSIIGILDHQSYMQGPSPFLIETPGSINSRAT